MNGRVNGTLKPDITSSELQQRIAELEGMLAERELALTAAQRREEHLRAALDSLHERTVRHYRQFQSLRAVNQAITACLDLRLTLNIVLNHVTTHLDIDAATILLLNPHTQTLEYAAGRGFRSTQMQHARVRLGESYAGRAAQERCLVSVDNVCHEGGCARVSLMEEEGLTAYYGVPLIARGQVKGVLELFRHTPLMPDQEWLDFLEALSRHTALALDNAELFDRLQRSNDELLQAYDATIEGWARALELRDAETEGHSRRVTGLTMMLARAMGIGEEELVHIRRGAILHDIGKMAIPDAILLKSGPLTNEEQAIMRQHPVYAYEWLSAVPFLQPALDIPYCHHERWDGTGYPRGLKSEDIPLAARIFAVVDVWDALCSDRPYRKGWSAPQVQDYLRAQAGTHLDPHIVRIFLQMIENT
ncbi:MAG: HD domain-containing protein [Chloroflexaceae bacterium]|nr:HD domain-containing protein [Chloroflexaceae bacterium]